MRLAILFVWAVLTALPARADSQTGDPREIFANAYTLYSGGKFNEAKELFHKTVNADFRLAVNRVLARLYRSGEIVKVYEQWFGPFQQTSTLLRDMYLLHSLPE